MAQESITFVEFARLVLDAIEDAELEYLIGGAVAVWAWGEVRTTQDFDLVVNVPSPKIRRLSQELEKRGMLVPPEIILDLLLMPEGDLPINAMHLESPNKAELFLLRDNDNYRRISLTRRRLVDLGILFQPRCQHCTLPPQRFDLFLLRQSVEGLTSWLGKPFKDNIGIEYDTIVQFCIH